MSSRRIGLAAQVGDDFPIHSLREPMLSLAGVSVYPGPSPRFTIVQRSATERAVRVDLGVASTPRPELQSYPSARHVHLATMPPAHQLTWLNYARRQVPKASVSVDMFEATVRSAPDTSIRLCEEADLAFMNEDEFQVLTAMGWVASGPVVLKRGRAGAKYIDGKSVATAVAPDVQAVDTTGAGEIIAGVFLALRIENVDIEEALDSAVCLASQSVAQFGVDDSVAWHKACTPGAAVYRAARPKTWR